MPVVLDLVLLPGEVVVCRLPADAPVPPGVLDDPAPLACVARTADELSIVCSPEAAPDGAPAEGPWAVLRVAGTLDFTQVGVLDALTASLAAARISVFAVSTFDTDYLLVPADDRDGAVAALRGDGHPVGIAR